MSSFWNTVLFGEQDYRGNPFSHHINLGLEKDHFDKWIELFLGTINNLFEGPKASEAIMRAEKMRIMFEAKLKFIKDNPDNFPIM